MIETEPSGADTLVVGRPIRKVLGWGVIAAITAAALARASTSEALRLLGLPDPGPLTIYGLPAVMAFGEVAAVMTVAVYFWLPFSFRLKPQVYSMSTDIWRYEPQASPPLSGRYARRCSFHSPSRTVQANLSPSCSPIQGCSLARSRTSMSQLHGHGPQDSHSYSRLRVV